MTQHDFDLVWEEQVDEYKSRARLWRHRGTGAELLSFCNRDENKVFGVSFRTPPRDSTGLPHILEHSVLCGSEKYPVKEPFVELLKGSLQTFLNAFTYPDKTCYPVASTNVRDFRNLTEVYLDAVFFPHITEEIFQQEGWHLIPAGTDAFAFKGVVYNEMKGVFSSPDAVLSRYSLHALFPDTIYGLESGGDPELIPTLTYADFAAFHREHYHPSNGRFFFWGDDDETERLAQLAPVLARFTRQQPAEGIALQAPFDAPRRVTVPYAATQQDDTSMICCNWVLAPGVTAPEDLELALGLRMLEHMLLGMPASPLRRALIESGLGEDLTGDGLEEDLRQYVFSVGLRGIDPAKAPEVEALITATLAQLARDGIPQLCVDAAVNSVEFSLRESNTGRFPAGLSVMLQALSSWLYDGNPLAPLRYEGALGHIKAHVAAKDGFFETLITRYFLDNPHKATVLLTPDTGLAARKDAEEQQRVDAITAGLDQREKAALAAHAAKLITMQESPDDPEALAAIPRLSVADLPDEASPIPSEHLTDSLCPIYFHGLPTNGIAYVEAVFDLGAVPQPLFPLLPLFGRCLLEMGTEQQDFLHLNMAIACKTGGMDASPLLLTGLQARAPMPMLALSGKATPDHISDLFALMREVLTQARFDDKERFSRMVLEEKARLEHSLIPGGHSFVSLRLRAAQSVSGWMAELTGGVEHLFFLRDLILRAEKDWQGIVADLEQLRTLALSSDRLQCNITSDSARKEQLLSEAHNLAAALPRSASATMDAAGTWLPRQLPRREALLTPAQVNYVGLGANLYKLGYQYHGSAQVILKHLRTGWLWEKVRVQGGAYGAFCMFDRMTGAFGLVSYRDPNINATLETFARTADHLRAITLEPRDLESAIVGAIGEFDAYLLPDAKGMAAFTRALTGDTAAIRRQLRQEILGTTQAHFRAFGDTLAQVAEHGASCVLGGPALEKLIQDEGSAWTGTRLL